MKTTACNNNLMSPCGASNAKKSKVVANATTFHTMPRKLLLVAPSVLLSVDTTKLTASEGANISINSPATRHSSPKTKAKRDWE